MSSGERRDLRGARAVHPYSSACTRETVSMKKPATG
jgi:hypothetical protein